MKALVPLLALLMATIFQTLMTGIWPSAVCFFDLPLIVVVYYALTKGPTIALLAGVVAGLLQDSLGGTLLGVSALSKALAGYIVGVVGLRFAPAPIIIRVVILVAATILTSFIEVGGSAIMGRSLAYSTYPYLLQRVVGNSGIGVLLIELMRRAGGQGQSDTP